MCQKYFLGGGGIDESFLSSVQDGVEMIISFLFFFSSMCVLGGVQPQAMLLLAIAFICLIKV